MNLKQREKNTWTRNMTRGGGRDTGTVGLVVGGRVTFSVCRFTSDVEESSGDDSCVLASKQ